MKQPAFNGKKHPVFWPWRKLGAGQSFWFQAAADCAGTHNCNWTHQPPRNRNVWEKVIQLCLQTEKNSTVSNLTIWFCKWLRGDLFYGSFTGPKCFSKTRKHARSSTWPLCDLCMLMNFMNFMNTDLLFFSCQTESFCSWLVVHPSLSRMKNQLIRRSLFGLAWHFNEGLAQDL